MSRLTPEGAMLAMWIGFTILWVAGATAVFIWAIRSGQFGDQERARSLALDGVVSDEESPGA